MKHSNQSNIDFSKLDLPSDKEIREETRRARISESSKGKIGIPHTNESRDKLSKINTGKKASAETRAKLSEMRKGRACPEQQKAKLSEMRKGKLHSEQTKAKISATKKSCPLSEETRAKLSEMRKGRITSQATKDKISQAIKQRSISWKKPCTTEHGVYTSIKAAGLAHAALGIINAAKKIQKKLKQGAPGYSYISLQDYIMLTGHDPLA